MGRKARDEACQVDRSIARKVLILIQKFPGFVQQYTKV